MSSLVFSSALESVNQQGRDLESFTVARGNLQMDLTRRCAFGFLWRERRSSAQEPFQPLESRESLKHDAAAPDVALASC